MDEQAIFNEVTSSLTRRKIIEKSREDQEYPFGYVITYLKDIYNLTKTQGYDLAKRICIHFNLWHQKD